MVPRGHHLYARRPADAYCQVHRAVAAAFAEKPALHDAPLTSPRGDYECFQEPVQGDVVSDGRKLAGGAQRRARSGMLHQGSIAGTIATAQLLRGFERALEARFESWILPPEMQEQARQLAADKYETTDWNRDRLRRR